MGGRSAAAVSAKVWMSVGFETASSDEESCGPSLISGWGSRGVGGGESSVFGGGPVFAAYCEAGVSL